MLYLLWYFNNNSNNYIFNYTILGYFPNCRCVIHVFVVITYLISEFLNNVFLCILFLFRMHDFVVTEHPRGNSIVEEKPLVVFVRNEGSFTAVKRRENVRCGPFFQRLYDLILFTSITSLRLPKEKDITHYQVKGQIKIQISLQLCRKCIVYFFSLTVWLLSVGRLHF